VSKEQAAAFGIDRARHHELKGRDQHVWERRAAIAALTVISILGLSNVFGQGTDPVRYSNPGVSLTVDSPTRVRGGLVFTTEFVIQPTKDLHDARLELSSGWFRGMTYNGLVPQPTNQFVVGPWTVFDLGTIGAGRRFPVWISWQTNATTVGRRSQDVAVYDGRTPILTVHRSLMVFP